MSVIAIFAEIESVEVFSDKPVGDLQVVVTDVVVTVFDTKLVEIEGEQSEGVIVVGTQLVGGMVTGIVVVVVNGVQLPLATEGQIVEVDVIGGQDCDVVIVRGSQLVLTVEIVVCVTVFG